MMAKQWKLLVRIWCLGFKGYVGIIENKMETTIQGLGVKSTPWYKSPAFV